MFHWPLSTGKPCATLLSFVKTMESYEVFCLGHHVCSTFIHKIMKFGKDKATCILSIFRMDAKLENAFMVAVVVNFKMATTDMHFIANRNTGNFYDLGLDKSFSYVWDRVCSIFSSAGKFCLAKGLRQLTQDSKSNVSCLQTMPTSRNENLRMTFGVSHHITFTEIIDKTLMKTINNR